MRIIYTNDFDFDETKSDLIESLECNDKDVSNITDDQVYDHWTFMDMCNCEDLEYEFNRVFENYDVICKADVGRWNGRFEAYKLLTKTNDLLNLLGEYDGVEVKEDKHHIYLTLSDHDATTYCELKAINKRGEDYIHNREYSYLDFEDLQKIFNNYSKLIREL